MQREEEIKINARRDAFTRIAFWQYMAFIFLLCFVWVIEVLDIPHRVFGVEDTPFSGHTYEQQRSLLRKLLKTCLYCHRVKTPHGHWEHVEEYFIKHYPVSMERGACPACEEMLALMNGKNDNITDAIARKGIESRRAEPACAAKAS
jgi:hypothetical protein